MQTLTIHNIPDELYNEIKRIAELHENSINNEVLTCLENTLHPKQDTVQERLKIAKKLRNQIKPNVINAEDIETVINEGRL